MFCLALYFSKVNMESVESRLRLDMVRGFMQSAFLNDPVFYISKSRYKNSLVIYSPECYVRFISLPLVKNVKKSENQSRLIFQNKSFCLH